MLRRCNVCEPHQQTLNRPRNRGIPAAIAVALLVGLTAVGGFARRTSQAFDETAYAEAFPLKQVADAPLPGRVSRFDYESIDAGRGLLFIAHLGDSEIVVFDLHGSRVKARIGGISSVHGVLAVPELSRVYASATGNDAIVEIDAQTLKVLARIPGGRYPDGMAYAPDVHKLYVSDEYGKTETVIDVRTHQRVATIALGGEAGNTQYDPASQHIFVTEQTHDRLVEIDPVSDRIVNRFELPHAREAHGLLIDPRHRFAFVACAGNNRLLVFDMRAMHIVQSFDVGGDPDVLAFDPVAALLYVAGEQGVISMFRVTADGAEKIGEGPVGPNAHVVAADAATHRVYFPLKNVGGRPVLRIMAPL